MNMQQMIKELEEAAQQLGLRVRLERGRFRGGRCTVGGEDLIVLNKRQPLEVQFAILAESLRGLPVDTVFLRPTVRKALEDAWARRTPLAEEETSDAD